MNTPIFLISDAIEEELESSSCLGKTVEASGGDGESLQPADVDFNLVANLLKSVANQEGDAGPASNVLNDLGFGK